MVCISCGKKLKPLQNYGSDTLSRCYDCKVEYDLEQERQEREKRDREYLEQVEKDCFKREILDEFKAHEEHFCIYHPTTPGVVSCSICGVKLCLSCSSNDLNEESICRNCRLGGVEPEQEAQGATSEVKVRIFCAHHPEVPAIQRCMHCKAPLCSTCDFSFSGGIHLCPTCVQKTPAELNPRINKNTLIAFGTAAGGFIALLVLLVFSSKMGDNEFITTIFGYAILLFSLLPAVIGCAMGLSVMPKKGSRPVSLVIALTCNIGLIAIILLLMIFGLSMG